MVQNPVGRFMVAAGAVVELGKSGKILLVKRSLQLDWNPGEWEICYGRIGQFEDVETGLRREIKEELGISSINIIKILRVWHMFRGEERPENELIGLTYHCQTDSQIITLSSEHTAYQWVLPDAALKLITVTGIQTDIKLFKSCCSREK